VLGGWIALTSVLENPESLAGGLDPIFMALQIAGVVIFVGAVLVSGWNLFVTWQDGRRWPGKAWSVLVFLASLLVLYVAYRFGLIALTVNY
jgi:hypothetical protein